MKRLVLITFDIPIADWILLYIRFCPITCKGHNSAAATLAHNQSATETRYEGCFCFLVKYVPYQPHWNQAMQ